MAARALVSAMTEVRVVIEKSLIYHDAEIRMTTCCESVPFIRMYIIYAWFLSDDIAVVENSQKILLLANNIHVTYLKKHREAVM